jgi:CRISPR-associated protein Cas5d
MERRSRRLKIRIRGELACFTRPELKAERVSYEVITPSAARGVVEAVLWKPAIAWEVHEIAVLNPIRWASFRRNEVKSKASMRMGPFFADEDRAQRNTIALRDVDYVVTVSFKLTENAGDGDTVVKFEEMFARRLEKGQCFTQPYLGCREFEAEVSPAPERFAPVADSKPLALLFYDFLYPGHGEKAVRPLFFNASLEQGVVHVPGLTDVLQQNGIEPGGAS